MAFTSLVRCDYCNGRLQRWEESDQPINEHARHYPNCDFLLPLMQAEKNPNVSRVRLIGNFDFKNIAGNLWGNKSRPF